MTQPLMPKATAVWLVENTALTFEQIAEFCNMHSLEIQAIADGEVGSNMQGLNPITSGALTQEEVDRCTADSSARLQHAAPAVEEPRTRTRGARYTPVSKRQDKPDAIAWLLKNYPELSDPQIARLIGTTKPTINNVRNRTHWNTPNIKPQNPASLGLCSPTDLEREIGEARRKAGMAPVTPRPADPEPEEDEAQAPVNPFGNNDREEPADA